MGYSDNFDNIKWSPPRPRYRAPVESKRGNFPTPMIRGEYAAYECPVTGKMIEGRYAHEENLKATGCRILERGEKEHNTKRAQDDAKAEDAKRDRVIDQIVDSVANDYF